MLEKITGFYQETQNPLCLLSHELLSTKIYYTSIYIFYILFISSQVQKSRNCQNPISTSKDTYKTILLFYFNCFLLVIHLNLM